VKACLRRRAPGGRDRGQGLVEFALVIPLFFLLVFGVIDGARLVFTTESLNQAAREAARVAAVEAPFIGKSGAACTAPVCPATTAAFRVDVLAAANRMSAGVGPFTSSGLYIDCTVAGSPRSGAWTGGNDCSTNRTSGSGNTVNIRLTASYKPLTPIVGPLLDSLFPSAETLWAGSSMVLP
jgi:Flp pilus assembly protein TadG